MNNELVLKAEAIMRNADVAAIAKLMIRGIQEFQQSRALKPTD